MIATPIFGKIDDSAASSLYPHKRRLMELFRASLEKPVSPYVVGEVIREIVDGGSWQLRYPVGPDAAALIGWRTSMTDEQWVDGGTVTDEQWVQSVRTNFGLDVKLD